MKTQRITATENHALPSYRTYILLFLLAAWVMTIALGTAAGAVAVPFFTVVKIILSQLPLVQFEGWTPAQEMIVLTIRLPRVLMAALIGGGLAVSGAALQAFFRNPMADPGIIGISSGGALAAVIAITTGFSAQHYLALPASAFLGAWGALCLVYAIASRQDGTPAATLLLSGIAVDIFMGALLSLILSRVDSVSAFREIFFWLMGGLDGRGWGHFKVAFWPILSGSAALLFFSRDLNLLLLEGETGAQALGMEVKQVQRRLLIFCALIIGTSVAFSGTVPFVGLIVPHIVRLTLGPNHDTLLPASFLSGGILLTGADLLARTLAAPEELRLGVVTSLIGAPFFLYLLQKKRSNTLL